MSGSKRRARYRLPLALLGLVCASAWAGPKAKTSVADLRYGVALYDYYQQDYLSALSELMVADARNGIQGHGNNPELIAGGISLAFGMEAHAENVFRDILQDNSRPQAVRDAAWFYLGKLQYLRGEWDLAAQSFARVSPEFKPGLRAQMESLQINIAIHQQQIDGYSLAQLKKAKLGDWNPYVLYNLGAAHARAGDFKSAQDYFRELADWDVSDNPQRQREQWALQDKAHTAMGYSYLAQQSYVGAIEEFTRVRLDGLYANQALLGYGWAAVAQEEYAKALKPWQLLRERSLIHPEVQESLLALPYAYEKLKAPGEAVKAYQTAENLLQNQINLLRDMRASLTREQLLTLIGSEPVSAETLKTWSKQGRDDNPGQATAAVTDDGQNWLRLDQTSIIKTRSAYLSELFAHNEFQAAVLQLRDLLRLQKLLRDWQPKLDIYQELLLEKQAERGRQEQQMATNRLSEREQELNSQRDQLQAQIQQIENDDDYVALADEDTQKLYARVKTSRATIARMQAEGQDPSDEQARLKMFGGILLWRAAEQFPAHLAELKAQLQTINQTLAQVRATRERVDTLMATSIDIQPKLVRLQVLAKDTAVQLARADQLIDTQAQALQQQVDKQLVAQEKRLNNYLAQAHLAVARLYDTELRKESK